MTAKFLKAIFLMILTALILSAAPASAADDLRPELKINRDKGDTCVEPVEVMRKDHMKFLLHKRDETVKKGVRTEKYSLKECINCHANKDEQGKYIAVNAPGEFCSTCHIYSSVKMDCFECHATKPRENTAPHSIVTPDMTSYLDAHKKAAATEPLNKSNSTN